MYKKFLYLYIQRLNIIVCTSNQIRTDDIYLEGRGYTNLTILAYI